VAAPFKILFVADVVGEPGRKAVEEIVPRLKEEHQPDLVVANGENSAGGFGLTVKTIKELRAAGCEVITTGNHVFDQRDFVPELAAQEHVLRPANYPPGAPGVGQCVVSAGGEEVLVMNLMGRLFMNDIDDPFRAADAILAAHPENRIVLCDMHAEATSEKISMGWYLDGRVSAVVGTHTHVPTADHRVLPGGTAYCTDVGMVGPRDGVIGMDRENVLKRFLTAVPQKWRMASGAVTFNSVLITIDRLSGRATSIQRIDQEQT
jgi:2',3'-cyclic-nucleotide 2'-phosphodiesterase